MQSLLSVNFDRESYKPPKHLETVALESADRVLDQLVTALRHQCEVVILHHESCSYDPMNGKVTAACDIECILPDGFSSIKVKVLSAYVHPQSTDSQKLPVKQQFTPYDLSAHVFGDIVQSLKNQSI
jgi:hypothetical protein